jgi:sterol desaturase/sphingolipid hydroxylase (fatty acid hydroxylase superfamily)
LADSVILGLGLLGWFVVLAGAEAYCASRRPRIPPPGNRRLVVNFGLGALVIFASSMAPIARIASAEWAQSIGLGIVRGLALPWLAITALLFIGDSFAAYWTHRAMHAAPLLWRVHRVHHSDGELDVSTGLRNHPLELVVSIPASLVVVLLIGAPASAVLAVQTIAFGASIWQHADVDLPERLDRLLNSFLVTPRLHRVHHNPERALHDSNFGELITLWDRMFGTLRHGNGRGRVGLEGQVAPPDALLQQIWSPVHQV